MTNIQMLIKKHHIELAKQGTEDALKMPKKPTAEEFEILKANKIEIIAELRRQWYEEDEKELIEAEPTTRNVYAYGECIGTEKIK